MQCPHSIIAELESIVPGKLLYPASDGIYYWHLLNKTPDMGDAEVIEAFRVAFNYIGGLFAPLRVESTSDASKAQIRIRFAQNGEPGLPFPFESGVLAYAFAPTPGWEGKMFINEEIDWSTLDKPGNIQLMKVVTHEILHLFNASHSDNRQDIMYPYYQVGTPIVFTRDTVDWIDRNYSELKSQFDPPPPKPKPEPPTPPQVDFPLSEVFPTKKDLGRLTERQLIPLANFLGLQASEDDLKRDTVAKIWQRINS